MARKKGPHHLEIAGRMPAKELATLLRVSSALATSLDLSIVLQTAIESTCEILSLETGAIYELQGDELFLGATTPPLPAEMQWLRLRPEPLHDHSHIQKAFALGRPVYVTDAKTEPLTSAEASIRDARHLCSILYIPLLLDDQGIGVLIVGTTGKVRQFHEDEIDLCRVLSYQVTLALTNARLYRSVQQTNVDLVQAYDATLLGWSLALEMRDQETQGHTQRVTNLTLELARAMGIAEDELVHIRRGALLHDIGKMSIPDAILKKAGPLTEAEWATMRRHPEYAYRFLRQIDYLAPALEIPYCHHEKWDGSGYPRGLRGEAIPLSARIFAVADVFDALTSDRPYREALDDETACIYVEAQAGLHLDPQVVRVFLEKRNRQARAGCIGC